MPKKLLILYIYLSIVHLTSTVPPKTTTTTKRAKFERIDKQEECRYIPKFAKLPIECCMVTDLFDDSMRQDCRTNCESSNSPRCCAIKCLFEMSDLLEEEKFSKPKAKLLLNRIFANQSDILSLVDKILGHCEEKGLNHTSNYYYAANNDHNQNLVCPNPEYGIILSCIHRSLFRLCPDVKPDEDCKEIKQFMDKCRLRNFALKDFKLKPVATTTRSYSNDSDDSDSTSAKDDLGEAMQSVIKPS